MGYGVVGVEPATWIKPNLTAAFLLTFNRELAPESVKAPGESHRTKVYEYKQRPMQCKKRQQYQHTINRCRTEFTICGKCAAVWHRSEVCVAAYLKCPAANHTAGIANVK